MTTTMKKPSQKSLDFLTDLVRDRDVSPGKTATQCLAELAHWLATPRSQKDVSAMIDRSRKAPKRSAFTPAPVGTKTVYTPYPSVPESVPSSKFAVLTELLTEIPDSWRKQELLFLEVKQYRGKRVIRRLTGAPGKFNRHFLPASLAAELFGHLERQDFAYNAAQMFGKHYTVCGRCAAELTDDMSRERLMGPICWDLMEPWRNAALAASVS